MVTDRDAGRGAIGSRIALQAALERLAREPGRDYLVLSERGGVEVGIYRPVDEDSQSPHARDELYVIISGHGNFMLGPERLPFEPGDVFFVPAGEPHHFEEFSAGFVTWVIFFGGESGGDG